ncbi:hypothetical protein [Rhabdaerophilum sp. SD176]|uniref:hypothetical protein n=1 Tax=Rhabdaerophilum sp. SD176 TaxID=2983548 RepID=UPI0024DF3E29|nr:hypothetical protein [Rhabdaerophilum sp. SD176]
MKRWLLICSLAMGMQCAAPAISRAESEPHPAKAWRPLTMVDLRLVGPNQLPTARLWHDRLAAFSKSKSAPLNSSLGGQSAMAANVVIRSPEVVVMLSILQVEGACEPRPVAPQVLICPMRLVRFDPNGTTIREGKACFVGASAGGAGPRAYASYDPRSRAIRLGVVAGGEAVDGCSQSVPVRGE